METLGKLCDMSFPATGEGQLVTESRRTSTQKSARTFKLYLPPDCEKMWLSPMMIDLFL